MLQPHFEILPAAQGALWPSLAEVPSHFVLYGGTALALRVGHRRSLDFDFFTSEPLNPSELLANLKLLRRAKVLQRSEQGLTVRTAGKAGVKLSFFGGLTLGRVGEPERTVDGVLLVASLLDIAGMKAAVISQRAECKDYLDLLALVQNGVSLASAMAAASAIYGDSYNPLLTLKSMTYFGDGDLHKLTASQKKELIRLAAEPDLKVPTLRLVSKKLGSAS